MSATGVRLWADELGGHGAWPASLLRWMRSAVDVVRRRAAADVRRFRMKLPAEVVG